MRVLLLFRGVPGCGKSTFIKEYGLDPYVLSPDALRLMFASPVLELNGRLAISQQMDKYVWPIMMNLVHERMKRGCFTVIDATNIKTRDMESYLQIAKNYNYQVYVIDFTDVNIDEAKRRNLLREEYKQVPEHVIDKMNSIIAENSIPLGIEVLRPNELDKIWYKSIDLSQYRRIIHIGDSSRYDVLENFFDKYGIDNRTCYIFIREHLKNFNKNGRLASLMLKLSEYPNILFVEGCSEEQPYQDLNKTGISTNDIEKFYHKMSEGICYTYHGKKVLVTNGGLSRMPENMTFIAAAEMIYGSGEYENSLEADETFANLASQHEYQIHGYRNTEAVPVKVNSHCFNLKGDEKNNEKLRIVELTEAGFKTIEI